MDEDLFEHVAAVVAVPRVAAADSFVLHAPLELLARSALLALIDPAALPEARERILEIATQYEAFGPGLSHSEIAAVDDEIEAWCPFDDNDRFLRAIAVQIAPRLSAAAHGSIFVHLTRRTTDLRPSIKGLLRPLARELMRHPDWNIQWITGRSATAPTNDLADVLLDPPSPGPLETNFIYPTMALVDNSGLAAKLLDSSTIGHTVSSARKVLLRTAAHSMLQDDPAHAPYGWSHCLTMPQGTLGIADLLPNPDDSIAIAATYVLGFRATLGTVRIDPTYEPEFGGRTPADVLADALSRAAVHHDAHLAKYALACYHATMDDPEGAPLYSAAAAKLADWWDANG